MWDESLDATRPLRHFLDEAAAMFPAVPGPFLQLTTGLCQGREAGDAAYSYICNKPSLAVAYEAGSAGVLLQVSGKPLTQVLLLLSGGGLRANLSCVCSAAVQKSDQTRHLIVTLLAADDTWHHCMCLPCQ